MHLASSLRARGLAPGPVCPELGPAVPYECSFPCGASTVLPSVQLVDERTPPAEVWLREPAPRMTHLGVGLPLRPHGDTRGMAVPLALTFPPAHFSTVEIS